MGNGWVVVATSMTRWKTTNKPHKFRVKLDIWLLDWLCTKPARIDAQLLPRLAACLLQVTAGYLVNCLLSIDRRSSIDIFFLDWEKSIADSVLSSNRCMGIPQSLLIPRWDRHSIPPMQIYRSGHTHRLLGRDVGLLTILQIFSSLDSAHPTLATLARSLLYHRIKSGSGLSSG